MLHRLLAAAGGIGGFTVNMTALSWAAVRRSTNQTIANDTFDCVLHDTLIHDSDSYWSAGTPYQFTIPHDGTYIAGGHLRYSASQNANAGVRNQSIYVDGTVTANVLDPATATTTYADMEWPNSTLTGALGLITLSGPPMELTAGQKLNHVAYMFVSGGGSPTVDIIASGTYSPLFWVMRVA